MRELMDFCYKHGLSDGRIAGVGAFSSGQHGNCCPLDGCFVFCNNLTKSEVSTEKGLSMPLQCMFRGGTGSFFRSKSFPSCQGCRLWMVSN